MTRRLDAREQMMRAIWAELDRQCRIGAGTWHTDGETGLMEVHASLDPFGLADAMLAYTPIAQPVAPSREAVAELIGQSIELAWNGSGSDGQPNNLPPISLSHHERRHLGFAVLADFALTPGAAKSDAVEAAIALVRRIADQESWQSHYGKRWEDEAAEIVAALATRPDPASTSGRNDP